MCKGLVVDGGMRERVLRVRLQDSRSSTPTQTPGSGGITPSGSQCSRERTACLDAAQEAIRLALGWGGGLQLRPVPLGRTTLSLGCPGRGGRAEGTCYPRTPGKHHLGPVITSVTLSSSQLCHQRPRPPGRNCACIFIFLGGRGTEPRWGGEHTWRNFQDPTAQTPPPRSRKGHLDLLRPL